MGFVYQRETYKLVFEGNLAGLEIVAKSASAAVYRRISAMAHHDWASPMSGEDMDEFEALCQAFTDVLVSWNLEEEHEVKGKIVRKAVPATLNGLMGQDLKLIVGIVWAWMDAIEGRAAVGTDLDESSLPMETLP
jgi:hypothetical protein